MFDNYYTKYNDAAAFINGITAKKFAELLEAEVKSGTITAEKYAYLSKAYIYLNESKKALNAAKAAVKLDKTYAYGYIRLAFAYGHCGNKKEAVKAVSQAEKFGAHDWFVQSYLVSVLCWLDETEKAKSYFEKLVSAGLDTPDYYFAVGFAAGSFDSQEKIELSIEFYNKALDFRNEYDLFYKLMCNYGKVLDEDNALKYLNKCYAFGETQDLLEKKIQFNLWKNKPDAVIDDIRRYYKTTENKQTALILLAQAFSLKQDFKKALKYLKFAYYTTDAGEELYFKLAECFENLCDYQSALDFYKKALKFNKSDEDILLGISYCYSKLKEPELASLYADKVLLLNPQSAYPYYRKGNLLCESGDYEKACEMYKKAVEKDSSDVDYYGSVSFAYSMLKNYELSLEYANRGLLINKNDYYINFRKGWALQALGRYNDAIRYYEICIENDESYVDAYANISYCYSKLNDNKKSILYANKAMIINKDYAYAHYRKAWALAKNGETEEAKDFFNSAIELDPCDTFSYIGLSAANLETDNAAGALKAANLAIFTNRECAEAYYFKGLALSSLGKTKDAEKCYSKAAELGYAP